jgi:hypothetical protein
MDSLIGSNFPSCPEEGRAGNVVRRIRMGLACTKIIRSLHVCTWYDFLDSTLLDPPFLLSLFLWLGAAVLASGSRTSLSSTVLRSVAAVLSLRFVAFFWLWLRLYAPFFTHVYA